MGISLFQNMGSFTHHKKRRLPENGEGGGVAHRYDKRGIRKMEERE